MQRHTRLALAACFLLSIGSQPVFAQSVTLAWDPSSNADGYLLWRGTASGSYSTSYDVGNVTEYTVADLAPDQTYFFSVQAYGDEDTRSPLSPEIVVRLASGPPAGTPFRLILRNDGTGAINYWQFDGTNLHETGAFNPSNPGLAWHVAATADMTGDGEHDLVWQSTAGDHLIWQMAGARRVATLPLTPGKLSPVWRIAATVDLDSDSHQDLIWQSTAGNIGVWLMNRNSQREVLPFTPNFVGENWFLEAAADMTGDGFIDLIWRNAAGNLGIWEMAGTVRVAPAPVEPNFVGPGWKIIGAHDVNNDGHPDLIWQSLTSNTLAIWTMDRTRKVQSLALSPAAIPRGWSVSGLY